MLWHRFPLRRLRKHEKAVKTIFGGEREEEGKPDRRGSSSLVVKFQFHFSLAKNLWEIPGMRSFQFHFHIWNENGNRIGRLMNCLEPCPAFPSLPVPSSFCCPLIHFHWGRLLVVAEAPPTLHPCFYTLFIISCVKHFSYRVDFALKICSFGPVVEIDIEEGSEEIWVW